MNVAWRRLGSWRSGLWLLLGLGLVTLFAWLNRFPDGMIFAGGDVVQYFDRDFAAANLKPIWSHLPMGEGYFSPSYLYYPFYVVVFAISGALITTAAAPSLSNEQSSNRNGSEMIREAW